MNSWKSSALKRPAAKRNEMANLIMDISNINVGRASRLPSTAGASPIWLQRGQGRRDAGPTLRPAQRGGAARQSAVSQIGNLRPLDPTAVLPTASRRNSRLPTCVTPEREAPTSQPHRRVVSIISTGARLFLVLVSLLLVSGCSKQAKKERHLKQADQYFDAKDFKKAEIEYLNVLRVDRTNAWVVKRLATIYYDQGRMQQA